MGSRQAAMFGADRHPRLGGLSWRGRRSRDWGCEMRPTHSTRSTARSTNCWRSTTRRRRPTPSSVELATTPVAWVHFPKGFGGLGLRPELNRHVEKRIRDAGAQPGDPTMFFMALAGPTIVTHATDEQKRRFLRPMFTGEERGASCSPNRAPAPTSPASHATVRDGDEWIVNGQKVWNTIAHIADRGCSSRAAIPSCRSTRG